MDTSWPGYDEIPTWVVEGYYTMLRETDRQVVEPTGRPATCAIASVSVGSWAQAITLHYKRKQPSATVVRAEPAAAACLQTSLKAGRINNKHDHVRQELRYRPLASLARPR